MSMNEKLGIDITLNFGTLKADLDKIGDMLGKAFGTDSSSKMGAAAQSMQQKILQVFANYQEKLQKVQDETNRSLARYQDGQQKIQDNTLKTYAKYLDDENKLRVKQKTDAQKVQDDTLRSLAKYLQDKKRLEQQAQVDLGASTMATYRNNGFQPVNGGYVMSSVNTSQSVNAAHAEALKMTAREAGKLDMALGNVAKRLIEFYAIRGALFAVSNAFQQGVGDLIKYNQGLADTAAISNASTESMNKIGEAAKNIARNSKESLPEVMKMFNLLAQSGVNEGDVPAVGKAINMFSMGTGSSMENAVRVTTTALNVWNYEAKDTTKILNVMTAGLNASKLEVNELSTVFNYLASSAAQVGMSLEETTAVVASMSQAGIKASTIGTSISMLMTRLMAPTPKLKKFLGEFGINDLDEVNPRLHKFADIIDRLKQAKLPQEGIMGMFDQRAGRALQAALNLGADYFKMMEANVTGTSAMITAFEKSMTGPTAKLNVLRQEFVQLIGVVGGEFTGVLGKAYDALLMITKGLQTAEGQLTVFVVSAALAIRSIDGIVTAVKAFKAANPELFAFSVALTAVVAAVGTISYAIGKHNDNFAAPMRKEYQGLVKEASEAQRVFTTLSGIYAKAAAAGTQDTIIKGEAKEALTKLKNAYPQHLKNLDLEHGKYLDIKKVMADINAGNEDRARRFVDLANKSAEQIKLLRSTKSMGVSQADREDNLDRQIKYYKEHNQEEQAAVLEAQKQKIQAGHRQTYSAAYDQWDKSKAAALGTGNAVELPDGKLLFVPAAAPKDKAPGPGYHPPGSGKTPKDPEETYLQWAAKKGHEFSTQLAKSDRKLNEDIVRDKEKTEEERNEALWQVVEDNEAIYQEKLAKAYEENQQKAATALKKKGLNDYDRFLIMEAQQVINAKAEEALRRERDTDNDLQLKASSKEKAPAKDQFIAEREEKQADRLLQLQSQGLTLRKTSVYTAQQLYDIEIEDTNNQLHNATAKKIGYEHDIKILELKKLSGTISAEETIRLEDDNAKLEAILTKQRELTTLKQLQASGELGYAKQGAGAALANKTNTHALSTQLGADLVNTTFDGITNSINGMVTALEKGGNAWKAFKTGLGTMIRQIADILQQYIIKMMVVYAVQNLIGMVAPGRGSASSMENVNGKVINNGQSFTWGTGATGGLVGLVGIGNNPVMQLAGGGFIPMGAGKAGVDSVPAMLMPGEFVVPKNIVDKYGVGYFEQMRAQKFAEGGLVGGGIVNPDKGSAQDLTLTIINIADPKSIPKTTGNEILNVVSFDIERNGPVYKQLKAKLGGN